MRTQSPGWLASVQFSVCGVDGSVRVRIVGPGAVREFEGHHERQPGGVQVVPEVVVVAVGAAGGHRAEGQPGHLGPGGEAGCDLQLAAEARAALALREVRAGA
jgi:hypothetical protein